jgi:hypothetical protein
MASKDGVTFRVTDAGGEPVSCASLGSVAAMAPNKVKQLKALGEPQVQSIGKGYLALVGACEGQGPKGRAELHFAAIEMKESDGTVWNAVLSVNLPEGTPPAPRTTLSRKQRGRSTRRVKTLSPRTRTACASRTEFTTGLTL